MRILQAGMLCVGLGGCFGTTPRQHFEQYGLPKAEFDLNCPRTSIMISELGPTTMGVSGCSQQARYELVRTVGWVLDSVRRPDAPPPQAGPPGRPQH